MVRLKHSRGFYGGVSKLGGTDTYIEVDATAKSIVVYIDGAKVEEWS